MLNKQREHARSLTNKRICSFSLASHTLLQAKGVASQTNTTTSSLYSSYVFIIMFCIFFFSFQSGFQALMAQGVCVCFFVCSSK